ncbi:ABC transporter ATP-binding protein [Rhodobacter capsulatus]|uniref:ABC transporter ATP-binding protein n=1 Tax=Rhodobacter capsulatus TaxID=1061 RepID=UPI0003D2F0E7|nr:ABC transporter ATP-binding protein [Rhodobacter capsulatus YW2]
MTQRGLALRIEGLRLCGEGGRQLLQIPRLQIAAGAAVVLRGPSGAGKSTLLHVLAGLITPQAGRVLWGGTDIAALRDGPRAAFRRATIGLVFQDPLLFEELSAQDNAALTALYAPAAARAEIAARAEAALARLGLSPAGRRAAASYSGGERQRIAVARALAGDPAVLLADEPTASLDRANADRLSADLIALARQRGQTLIVASHDPALMALAGQVIDLRDGEIAEAQHG